MSKKFGLFSVYGIEAEYMIVDRESLKVKPIADKVLTELNGGVVCNQAELGRVSWSNELVNHVLEIKCTSPERHLDGLDEIFHSSIMDVNRRLEKWKCTLMPTSMNPWFDPMSETVLWPHEQRDIYDLYNEIFDCRGHGWSNLQSVHINLPYKNEREFVDLHSAIRIILPLIPFLAASSPFYEGKRQSLADNRLFFYEKNQSKVPSIIGNIIPENVKSIKEYKEILAIIYQDISIYDNAKTLQNPWLNSRAAIPKFDVGAIEIRLMDIQESPLMDFAIICLIVEMVKYVCAADDSLKRDVLFSDRYLRDTYDQAKSFDPKWELTNYYKLFDLSDDENSFKNLILQIIGKFRQNIPSRYHGALEVLSSKGNLSSRLVNQELNLQMYQRLIGCLQDNKAYED